MLRIFKVLLVLCSVSLGQELYGRSCKSFNLTAKTDIDVAKCMGRWYEQERYDSIYQAGTECVTIDYSEDGDGKIKIENSAKYRLSNSTTTMQGVGTMVESDNKEGRMSVVFPFKPSAEYLLLETDYVNYTILWSCTDSFFGSFHMLWVLTREQEMSDAIKKDVNQFLSKTKLDASRLKKTTEDVQVCAFDNSTETQVDS